MTLEEPDMMSVAAGIELVCIDASSGEDVGGVKKLSTVVCTTAVEVGGVGNGLL